MQGEIRESLKKQLQLLSECSLHASSKQLPKITEAMMKIVDRLSKDEQSN
jgi:hypothetical protein